MDGRKSITSGITNSWNGRWNLGVLYVKVFTGLPFVWIWNCTGFQSESTEIVLATICIYVSFRLYECFSWKTQEISSLEFHSNAFENAEVSQLESLRIFAVWISIRNLFLSSPRFAFLLVLDCTRISVRKFGRFLHWDFHSNGFENAELSQLESSRNFVVWISIHDFHFCEFSTVRVFLLENTGDFFTGSFTPMVLKVWRFFSWKVYEF